ncbi:MAG: hypothetical protein Q8Q18_01255 [bacterium]|nr:hypothetical protein [bacterium]
MEQQQEIKEIQMDVAVSGDEKLWAVISYIPPLFILTMLMMKEKPFVLVHSKQALALFITAFVLSIMNVVPILGWIAYAFVSLVLSIVWVIAILYAISGKTRVPILASLADKLPM